MGFFGFGRKKVVGNAPVEKSRLEGRGEKPDTPKPNQALDKTKKEPPKPVVVKIPDDALKLIGELGNKKQGLLNQFLGLSAQLVEMQTNQKTILEEVKKVDRRIHQEVDFAGTKLKLNKEYKWRYDSQGNFVGTLKPKPKELKKPSIRILGEGEESPK